MGMCFGKAFSEQSPSRSSNPFASKSSAENGSAKYVKREPASYANEEEKDKRTSIISAPNTLYEEQRFEEAQASQAYQQPVPTDTVVIAQFDFERRTAGELSFKKGDRLLVLDVEDDQWITARHEVSGDIGYVPQNCVVNPLSLDIHEWYFGPVNRREAEALLLRCQNGTFLVRESSIPGNWALSIKHAGEDRKKSVRHFTISYLNYMYNIYGTSYNSIAEMIEVCKVNEGILPLLLTKACPKYQPAMTELCRETKHVWEIDRNEITLVRKVGQGNFGDVYCGIWSRGRQPVDVAVKTLKKGSMSDEEFLDEAKIMKGLDHDNILKLLATCSKEEPIYIVTQYMENGSLQTVLKRYKEQEAISFDQMLEFSFQISKGMAYLEEKNLIHRDLAARNVLVDDRFTCKIADFGLAKILDKSDDSQAVSHGKFPVKWSPPEVLVEGIFSIKSDVWSFGIVMIEIFTYGDTLYPGMDKTQVRLEVVGGYRPPQPPVCPTYIYEVLLKCWDQNPDGRPTFRELKKYLDDSSHMPQDGTQYLIDDFWKQKIH